MRQMFTVTAYELGSLITPSRRRFGWIHKSFPLKQKYVWFGDLEELFG